jgi:hypothetical protein
MPAPAGLVLYAFHRRYSSQLNITTLLPLLDLRIGGLRFTLPTRLCYQVYAELARRLPQCFNGIWAC